jgi:hypothetical protein
LKPCQGKFLCFAEIGLVEVTGLRTIGIPVPSGMTVLTASSQGALRAGKSKRARSWLVEPDIPRF